MQSAKSKLRLLGVAEKEIARIKQQMHADKSTVIYAPASGWIMEKQINGGSSFKTMGKLFQIVNLEHLWVEMKYYQEDLHSIERFKTFHLTVKGVEETFTAQKSLLYPFMDPKEATATLRLTLNNPDGTLRPGMYATISASAPQTLQLLIPRTAAIRKENGWYAFLATEFKGEYEPVRIEIEPLDAHYFIVTKGLREGERIVNNALFMMDSDAQINSSY